MDTTDIRILPCILFLLFTLTHITITRRVGEVSCLVVVGDLEELVDYTFTKHLFDVGNAIETAVPKR